MTMAIYNTPMQFLHESASTSTKSYLHLLLLLPAATCDGFQLRQLLPAPTTTWPTCTICDLSCYSPPMPISTYISCSFSCYFCQQLPQHWLQPASAAICPSGRSYIIRVLLSTPDRKHYTCGGWGPRTRWECRKWKSRPWQPRRGARPGDGSPRRGSCRTRSPSSGSRPAWARSAGPGTGQTPRSADRAWWKKTEIRKSCVLCAHLAEMK